MFEFSFSLRRAETQALIRKLGAHMPCGMAKKEKKKKITRVNASEMSIPGYPILMTKSFLFSKSQRYFGALACLMGKIRVAD